MTKSRGLVQRLSPPRPLTLEWLVAHATETAGGCLEWNHARSAAGYGQLRVDGRNQYTHRLACRLAHGEPARGDEALHSCDNPACLNPAHLDWGSHLRNMREAQERERIQLRTTYRGVRHHSSRLSWEQAQQIRARHAAGETQVAIARDLGLHHTSVWAIVHWKTWIAPEGIRPT